jgi:hypothetical protein
MPPIGFAGHNPMKSVKGHLLAFVDSEHLPPLLLRAGWWFVSSGIIEMRQPEWRLVNEGKRR